MNIRVMRGQCVVRELRDEPSNTIWTPEETQRKQKTHRGRVLAIGKPSLLNEQVEVPWGFDVGDVVQFHFTHHRDAATRKWPVDGEDATWIPQSSVDGVIA